MLIVDHFCAKIKITLIKINYLYYKRNELNCVRYERKDGIKKLKKTINTVVFLSNQCFYANYYTIYPHLIIFEIHFSNFENFRVDLCKEDPDLC